MKTKLLAFSFFALASFGALRAQWTQQTSNTAANLTGIHCTDTDTCMVAGTNGNVRKTVNGGTVWTVITSGTFTNMASIKFFNTSKIWIGLVNGTFRHSTNGGTGWSTVVGNTTHQINDIWYLNDTFYLAVGGNPANTATGGFVLLKSVNGTSWQSTNLSGEPAMYGIHVFNDSTYVVVGGAMTIKKTSDSAVTWTDRIVGNTSVVLYDVHFGNDTVGYAVGGNPASPKSGIVLKTIDAGNTWDTVATPDSSVWYGTHFVNHDTGFVVGAGGKIMNTIDGGINWTIQTSPVSTQLNKIILLNDSVGYIAGNGGVILKTLNGGGYLTTGVAQNFNDEEPAYILYGNPSRTQLMIETLFEMKDAFITVMDESGRMIRMNSGLTGNTYTLPTADLSSGIYFFRITDGNLSASGKFMVE